MAAGAVGRLAGAGAAEGEGPGLASDPASRLASALAAGPGAASLLATAGPSPVWVKLTYHPMNTIIMASTSSTSRSQNQGVSAGSAGLGGRLCARALGRRGSELTVSSAEGPDATKVGSRRAHPMQNMALGRFEEPQATQVTREGGDGVIAQRPRTEERAKALVNAKLRPLRRCLQRRVASHDEGDGLRAVPVPTYSGELTVGNTWVADVAWLAGLGVSQSEA